MKLHEIESTVRVAKAAVKAAARKLKEAGQKARFAKERSRQAKLKSKQARKEARQARKAARKAKDQMDDARQPLEEASAHAEKVVAKAAKLRKKAAVKGNKAKAKPVVRAKAARPARPASRSKIQAVGRFEAARRQPSSGAGETHRAPPTARVQPKAGDNIRVPRNFEPRTTPKPASAASGAKPGLKETAEVESTLEP